jgi:glycosyltransferase involved in cell wall biosynthesis
MPIQVSVIVPCRNEEKTIRLLLEALAQQSFPRSEMEVLIADGLSEDGTRDVIAEFKAEYPSMQLRILDNPHRIIPAALNVGIAAAQGEFILRMDAHAIPQLDYVARCVEALQTTHAENVGGVWEIQPQNKSWVARSIAAAAAHPLAVGDAGYRIGSQAGYVDTVPFGAFRRELIERIGPFDEHLLTNEDYEFNARIRQSGGSIWLDPQIRSVYFARGSLGELAKQYWRYGFWKAQMLKRYPQTLRLRQALPPLFVFSLILLPILSLVFQPLFTVWLIELGIYLAALIFVGIQLAIQKKDAALALGVPLAIATMHLGWGAALIVGSLSNPRK